ncbi:hypothetical protein L211DRAFT_860438 [Terfezia boudieri ATCC MYA-4762]|uniref:Uncharacterized protein n=1 Tax=Terfezia boudieri ATCC MYA-4762 TaxID=1051890 RepID=A0A3N4LWW6_9PEZI|nr:hypothetical protein L211DRAFT_860438 [Terfezia boudieri ATCC MYA-4762]
MVNESYYLSQEDGTEVQRDEQALTRGNYYVVTNGSITVNDEPWVAEFREAVRQKNRRCVITGEVAEAEYGIWRGFEAAHIFPLAYESNWIQGNYECWITHHPNTRGSINSVQNGLLLRSDVHDLFDGYDVSINPDNDYKVVCFRRDRKGIAGTRIEFGDDERRPVDQQAVLANMRGAGEPVFECDFPPGSDMMG